MQYRLDGQLERARLSGSRSSGSSSNCHPAVRLQMPSRSWRRHRRHDQQQARTANGAAALAAQRTLPCVAVPFLSGMPSDFALLALLALPAALVPAEHDHGCD